MTLSLSRVRRLAAWSLSVLLLVAFTGCTAPVRMPSPGEREPDKYLFDRGTESLGKRHWLDAKEYFQRIVDAYPQSPYRQGARLGIGDAELGLGTYDSYLRAAETFREFLRFFPLNERADYAQYRLALTQFEQMLSPDRDQTPTVDTLREIEVFIRTYPNSQYLDEVQALQQQARTRLSDSEMHVALHYFRNRWYPGAIPRLQTLLKTDPTYLKRDAAYYYLGESLYRVGRPNEGLPYFDKLVEEFTVSEFLDRAKARSDELKR